MKVGRINENQIGLVYRRGRYQKVLTAGLHVLGPGQTLEIATGLHYLMPEMQHVQTMLNDETLKEVAEVIVVSDTEIGVLFVNGNLVRVLASGCYVFVKHLAKIVVQLIDCNRVEFPETLDRATLSHSLMQPYMRIFTVEAYEKGVLIVDGKCQSILQPGPYYFVKNQIEVLAQKVDLRSTQMEISGQEILSADKVMLRVSAFVTYKVENVFKALVENKNYEKQLYVQIQLMLRNYLGSLTLDALLSSREKISGDLLETLQTSAAELGVGVTDLGIRDLILPGEVREIMNRVLIAEKQSEANAILRREETAGTRSMLNTARLLEENAMLFRLKEMEFMERIADKVGNITLHSNTGMADQLRQLFAPVT